MLDSASCAFVSSVLFRLTSLCSPWLAPSSAGDLLIGFVSDSKQGKPFEAFVQSKLPAGTLDLNTIKSNFSTFDHLAPDGTAISTKTMDTLGSVSYQKPANITRTLNKYVDDIVGFTEDGRPGGVMLYNSEITAKQMQLAIPYGTTSEQMTAIALSIQYAESQGVKIIVKKVR
ncbi:hypothetical protein ACI2S5_25330 [Ralstonia nicotianae]|uniref:endonuclease toxin domain-containing protein n=1 Tax=Ralstonia pseudosolanacearum TaxID=1310165 RepID=UPI0035E428BC